MSGDHNQYQKPRSYLDDFECPRCGHCCNSDLAMVGEVGVWGKCEPQEALEDGWCGWEYHSPMEISLISCDCGLTWEVDLRMVRYEYQDSEVYEVVDDPNLEVQMRLRRRDDLSPQRKWQGLTDEEVSDVIDNVLEGGGWLDVSRALEAAIKRKNT